VRTVPPMPTISGRNRSDVNAIQALQAPPRRAKTHGHD
jgi:hypothetical protein